MKIVYRPREKHTNADDLGKKSEFYCLREERRSSQGEVREGFSFLDQETYDGLPLVRWIDKTGNAIPDHPETLTMKVVKELAWSSREKEEPIRIPGGESHEIIPSIPELEEEEQTCTPPQAVDGKDDTDGFCGKR